MSITMHTGPNTARPAVASLAARMLTLCYGGLAYLIFLGTFLYAGLFATEGIGLLMRKRWAEYFTIVTTSLLIPLEVYEMFRHFTIVKLLVTLVNLMIVWYLAARVRQR